jgi:hypothetical protein
MGLSYGSIWLKIKISRQCLLLFLYWTQLHYMFRPNWPSSDVQFVVKDSVALYCGFVSFPPTVVASGNVAYVGCMQLLFCNV